MADKMQENPGGTVSSDKNNSEDLKTAPIVLIIKDVCLVLEIRVDVQKDG